jgi:hypothetical protein
MEIAVMDMQGWSMKAPAKSLTIIFSADADPLTLSGLPTFTVGERGAVIVKAPLWRWQTEPWGMLVWTPESVEGRIDRYRFPWSSISAVVETAGRP